MILELLLTLGIAQPTSSDAVREPTHIEQRLDRLGNRATAPEGAMIAPEWSVVHITGDTLTRAQALEMCRKPPVPIEALTIDDVAVRVFGEAAVVTGRTTVTAGGAKGLDPGSWVDQGLTAQASSATAIGTMLGSAPSAV